MNLRSIKIQNFLAIGDAEVEFIPGLTLIEGINRDEPYSASNGSGKSSLIEALFWGLYGQTIRKSLKDEIVNWKAGKNCVVEVEIESEGKSYRIRRSRAPATLALFSDGEDLTAHTMKDTERQIDDLIGIAPERFLQTILLEGGLKSSFSSLTDTHRKSFLEEITGLEVWERFQKASLRGVQQWRTEISYFESEIRDRKTRISEEQTKLREFRQDKKSPKALKAELAEKDGELRDQIKEAEGKIQELKDEWGEADREERVRATEASVLGDQTMELRKDIRFLENARAVCDSKIGDYESLQKSRECPTCFQKVSPDLYEEEIERLRPESEDHEVQIEEKRKALLGVEDELEKLNVEIRRLGKAEQEKKVMLKGAQTRFIELEDHRLEIKEQFQERIDASEAFEADLVGRQRKLKGETDKLAGKLLAAKEEVSYFEYWRKVSPEIRAKVMSGVLGYINSRLEGYSDVISDREEVIQLVLKRDKIDIVTQVAGETRKHALRSSGERRRTDLALQFALNDLAVATGGGIPPLLILDEVLDTLDVISTRRVLELLNQRALEENLCVFVTTHNPLVAGALVSGAHSLTVVKENGVARVT